jgi:mannose-6-phosphate isomerase-like protein (cupin superfamily)
MHGFIKEKTIIFAKVFFALVCGELFLKKKGFSANLESATLRNNDFRRVLYTAKHSQLVLMSLKPEEEIGSEVHSHLDQFFRFEKGKGLVVINGKKHVVRDGSCAIVPAGCLHNVINSSKINDLKLYTVYSPPEHRDKTIRKTKAEAMKKEEHFDGKTTE